MADPYEQEARRLADVLALVIHVAGRTRQSLEQQMGLSSGYLSKILSGAVELRVRHILAILEAVGLEPGHFFRLAFPLTGEPASEQARRLVAGVQAALGRKATEEPPPAPDFDDKVKEALRRLLGFAE